ncbi:MAG TPA: polysaccharide biosynthesis/export family protein [Pyrinomonadaceae bacterium]|nr:polysaccharide biosynthesis/export family protein [Pyrinomonadaceae bacterium]
MKRVLFIFAIALTVGASQIPLRAQSSDPAQERAADTSTSSNSSGATNAAENPHARKSHAPKKKNNNSNASASDGTAATHNANEANSNASSTAASNASASPQPASSPNSSTASSTAAPANSSSASPAATASAPSAALTSVYRVGAGDVLDIRLLNSASRESTLFTVLPGGLLEYTLAGNAIPVGGLTTDEISAHLKSKIRIIDNPQVLVSVREYVSHNVIVTGLVNDPGARILRREAVPLYVVLAEAQPRQDAGLATIMRNGESIKVDLTDANAASTLVLPGDVINVSAAPPVQPQYFYIGGEVGSPGQKNFHAGITLTQAILASGGVTRSNSNKVRVSRQGANGLLASTEYDLRKIERGLAPDPPLQPGDRIEVSH